ncbi:MAG TPA: hypothetical protein VHU19_14095 [Pyrinomonadaceae bacterium]|jgi:hypothetical protein|nr:hypothetical protein [Pyrinomonadaceae bacterium]
MGWEIRRGRRYYYRKVRGASGRWRSLYCGGGERGLAAEREDLERRTAQPSAQHGEDASAPEIVSSASAEVEVSTAVQACCAAPEVEPESEEVPHAAPVAVEPITQARGAAPARMSEREARAHVREKIAAGMSGQLAAVYLLSQGRIEAETYRRVLAGLRPRYRLT